MNKGLYSFYASIIIFFIIISLLPVLFTFFNNRVTMVERHYLDQYAKSAGMLAYKIGYLALDNNRLAIFNRGTSELYVERVMLEGSPINWSLIVYRGGWIEDDVIYPGELGILTLEGVVDIKGRLTIISRGIYVFINI